MAKPEQTDANTNLTPAQETLRHLWEEHVQYEFSTRNTEDTLATMVDDAYVNHIPVLTGEIRCPVIMTDNDLSIFGITTSCNEGTAISWSLVVTASGLSQSARRPLAESPSRDQTPLATTRTGRATARTR